MLRPVIRAEVDGAYRPKRPAFGQVMPGRTRHSAAANTALTHQHQLLCLMGLFGVWCVQHTADERAVGGEEREKEGAVVGTRRLFLSAQSCTTF